MVFPPSSSFIAKFPAFSHVFAHSSIVKCGGFHQSRYPQIIIHRSGFSLKSTIQLFRGQPPFKRLKGTISTGTFIWPSGRSSAARGPASPAPPWRRTAWSRRGWRRSLDPPGYVPQGSWLWGDGDAPSKGKPQKNVGERMESIWGYIKKWSWMMKENCECMWKTSENNRT